MHEMNFYDPEDIEDDKVLRIVTRLRGGTDLDTSDNTNEGLRFYKLLSARIIDRVRYFAMDFWAKSFIAHDSNGKPEKTKDFRQFWDNRKTYWDKTPHLPKSPRKVIPDNNDSLFVGEAPVNSPSRNPKQNTDVRKVCRSSWTHIY